MATRKSKKGAVQHVGFEAAARKAAAGYGGDLERGRRVIAAGARKASPEAKARNPRLAKVSGAGGGRRRKGGGKGK